MRLTPEDNAIMSRARRASFNGRDNPNVAHAYETADNIDARAMLAVLVTRERIYRNGWCASQNGAASKPRELCIDVQMTRRYVEAVNGEPLL